MCIGGQIVHGIWAISLSHLQFRSDCINHTLRQSTVWLAVLFLTIYALRGYARSVPALPLRTSTLKHLFLNLFLANSGNDSLTVDVGLSSTLPFGNWIVGTSCDGTSLFHIPPDLRHYLIIQEASYASFTSLPTPMTPHSLVLYSRSLATALPRSEQRLNDLMQTNMSLFNKMNLAAAQLYLQSMYFHLDDSESCRNAGILRTYTTALRLVDMAMSSTESSNILQYSPRTTVRMLNIAAAVIFRVLHSSLRGEVSYDAGRSLFNAAALCMSQQAVKSRAHDTPARWATFLHKMWEYGGKNEMLLLSPPMLQIKSRGGASILYDCLKMFRQKSQTSHNPQVRDVAVSELNLPINDQAMEPTLDSGDPDLFDFLWTDELCDSYLYDVS